MPFFDGGRYRNHIDAVHRAGIDTEVATGTFVGYHRMHLFGGAEDGVHGASLDALCAADTLVFAYKGDGFDRLCLAVLFIQAGGLDIEQAGDGIDCGLTARRAFIDGFALGDALGVRAAAGMTALAALGLRQQRVDLIDDGIAVHLKAHRGKA